MTGATVRRACRRDVPAIASLVAGFAAEQAMLPRGAEQIALALDDYFVGVDGSDRVVACGALREYSPSVAEVSSIAVGRTSQGRGVGRAIVRAVEDLASLRGYDTVFLVTTRAGFFEALGYRVVDSAHYPEKICPHGVKLAVCTRCEKLCMWRSLRAVALEVAA